MIEYKKNNTVVVIVVMSVIFGLIGGAVASLVINSYFNELYLPAVNEINFSDRAYRNSTLEIKDAKNVVVQQNDKTEGVINSVQGTLVGIFKKNISTKQSDVNGSIVFNLDNYYKIGQEAGQGFIISSDGWIITNFKLDDPAGYAVVTSDKKVYDIDKYLPDKATPFYFLHVGAKDFSVVKFADQNGIKNGQIALSVDWTGKTALTAISDKDSKNLDPIRSSDAFFSKISVADDLTGYLAVFNLAGETIGFIDSYGKVEPIGHFISVFSSLLKSQMAVRPSLGVNYAGMNALVPMKQASTASAVQGAVIYKHDKVPAVMPGGPAMLAGLKEGDMVLSVNNILIDQDNNLTDAIQRHQAGEPVSIVFVRGGEKKEAVIKLGEMK